MAATVGSNEPWVIDTSPASDADVWLINTRTGFFDRVKKSRLTFIAVGGPLVRAVGNQSLRPIRAASPEVQHHPRNRNPFDLLSRLCNC